MTTRDGLAADGSAPLSTPYAPPALTDLGSLAELTQGAGPDLVDGDSGTEDAGSF